MSYPIGALVRQERLRKNWSQQGLCQGICAVSYLSKIEQGQVQPSNDVKNALLNRLGLSQWTDVHWCNRAEAELQTAYQRIFSLSFLQTDPTLLTPWLQEHSEALNTSPYFLDMLLLDSLWAYIHDGDTSPLEPYASHFTGWQRALYLLCRGQEEEAASHWPCGYTCYEAGVKLALKGRYPAAIERLDQAFSLSCQACYPILMAHCKLLLGNCYSELHAWDEMEISYQRAFGLFQALKYPDSDQCCQTIHYNLGAVWIQRGQPQRGMDELAQCSIQDAAYCHKMAVALEQVGQIEAALPWIERGYRDIQQHNHQELYRLRLKLVAYRLQHPDYLDQPQYEQILKDCIVQLQQQAPMGWLRFELPWYIDFLEHKRQYKELASLLKTFSIM